MKTMKKKRGIITLVITCAVIVMLLYTSIIGIGPTSTGAAKNIKLGLDLAGGVSITYQVAGDAEPSTEDMADTIYKLQKRVESYSTEASVYQQGTNRISIEIPGVTDANAILEELGKPGSLYFITATDTSGNTTFQYDSSTGGYVLNYTEEELRNNGAVVLEGTDVEDAQAATQNDNLGNAENVVKLTMTDDGKEKFAEATTNNVNKQIAIVYDDKVLSAPRVEEAITGGEAVINGMSSQDEAEKLASGIRIGGLSLQLEELSSNVVGAQLGQNAIQASLLAGLIGLLLIFLLMCVAYKLPGFAASLALIIYTGLVMVFVNAFNVTLTLPGIAGIILSIGMAVDANVIIFARVKEEITAGRSVQVALEQGFHNSMSAIIDGNITTLITAFVLWGKGSGSVKGFAQTLTLGVVLSMFTALFVTKRIMYAFYALGLRDAKFYGRTPALKQFDFVGRFKVFLAVGVSCIVVSLVIMGVFASQGKGALNYSLEFKGGTATTVTMDHDYTLAELDQKVIPVVETVTGDADVQVQKVSGGTDIIIKTRTLTLDERNTLDEKMASSFGIDQASITAENISSTISKEMRSDAITALIIAGILILIYIWFRFSDIRFGASAIIILFHDVMLVLACYIVTRISVGNTFIACMLTIIGYSINSAIVIFDRIREHLHTMHKGDDLKEIVNKSIMQTMTRSIYTNLTTFIMIFMLFLLGGSQLREFALPLGVGVISGTYSDVFLSGPTWYYLRTKLGKRKIK